LFSAGDLENSLVAIRWVNVRAETEFRLRRERREKCLLEMNAAGDASKKRRKRYAGFLTSCAVLGTRFDKLGEWYDRR